MFLNRRAVKPEGSRQVDEPGRGQRDLSANAMNQDTSAHYEPVGPRENVNPAYDSLVQPTNPNIAEAVNDHDYMEVK